MSQEEEKLIEDLENEDWFLLLKIYTDNPNTNPTLQNVKDSVLKAFRAGKLAGFEMCEKMGDKLVGGLILKNDIKDRKSVV